MKRLLTPVENQIIFNTYCALVFLEGENRVFIEYSYTFHACTRRSKKSSRNVGTFAL